METTEERVARNVRRLREQRRHTVRSLSAVLTQLGRPILPSGITKIEDGSRRVDVGDLVALAVALEVSPMSLLLSAEPSGDGLRLTPELDVTWQSAWRWAAGEQPLVRRGEGLELRDPRVARFIADNRPFEERPYVNEAARAFIAREPAPFQVDIRHDGVRTTARLTYGDGDDGQRQ